MYTLILFTYVLLEENQSITTNNWIKSYQKDTHTHKKKIFKQLFMKS